MASAKGVGAFAKETDVFVVPCRCKNVLFR
jgi:hypothetical protein